MHREPDVGFDPGSPGSCPGPKAGAKPLRHPGIPSYSIFNIGLTRFYFFYFYSKGFSSFLLCSFSSADAIFIIIVLNCSQTSYICIDGLPGCEYYLILFFLNFYLFMIVTETERERERARDTGRGRSRLHAPGARCGIRSRVSRIVPWAKGRRQTAAPPRDPQRLQN